MSKKTYYRVLRKLISKETILPEYGIPNPKISNRNIKHLMKRKFISTVFSMLETFSVATIAISDAKHKKDRYANRCSY